MLTVDKDSPYVMEVPNVLTEDECSALIARIDELGPTLAPINTATGTRMRTDIRNNERVMFDDESLAEKVLEAVRSRVPSEMLGHRLVGANERFRCYRYSPGMRFAPHSDGSFVRNENERSFYSYLIYLNSDFEGGETNFFTQPELSIKPQRGMGLLFQHPIVHEGAVVESGRKYVARTDVMYRRGSS